MKKRNISNLKLRKSRISNLTLLHGTKGGTVTGATEQEPSNVVTENTDCGSCQECISENPTDCITNDTTKSLQSPSIVVACNGFGTMANC
ncbi:hypothetical protein [uncultured Kordia sp.]|uniref:hypothetical protein n=1 Tax=uncultured Kordia sp. TaxID=507699 RepID=UPI002618A1EB|nr:hypothetical protein [uncultured Kordia sp.]